MLFVKWLIYKHSPAHSPLSSQDSKLLNAPKEGLKPHTQLILYHEQDSK